MADAYPDSGNPDDYSAEQMKALTELAEKDKAALSKNQKAALARWKFRQSPAGQKAAEGAASGAPAAAPAAAADVPASLAGWPLGVPVPGDVLAIANKDPATWTKEEKIAVAKAKSVAVRSVSGKAPAAPSGPSPEEIARQKAREKALEFPYVKELKERFPVGVEDVSMQHDKPYLILKAKDVPTVLRYAKDILGFEGLQCLTAADYPPERIEVVYNLYDFKRKRHLAAKTKVPRDGSGCAVPSVVDIWSGADWLEREVLDMFGVQFPGHPFPKRLLLPEGWQGYPLRKDYDLAKEQFISVDERGDDVVSFREEEGW
ncbi:MAG: NADH-quinone oxidoreductase subunit C [Thermoplasmatota archaeon]